MADSILDLAKSWSANAQSGESRWRDVPMSSNVEDRRAGSLSDLFKDAVQNLYVQYKGDPVPWHNPNPMFPSGSYGSDIQNSLDNIRLQQILRNMGNSADNNVQMNSYFDTGNTNTGPIFSPFRTR